jgi:O-antigen ligase
MTFVESVEEQDESEASGTMEVGGVTVDTVGRRQLWERAISYFKESPVLGIGLDTFRHKEGMITHSLYMKMLAEQGIVGFCIYLFFISVVLRQSMNLYRHGRSELGRGIGLGVFLCSIVHLVGSVTGDQSMYYNLMAIFWVFVGILGAYQAGSVGGFIAIASEGKTDEGEGRETATNGDKSDGNLYELFR